METNEKVQKVIAALLSKTTANGCTEAEAASALEKAQELLLRHNLTEETVRLMADGTEALRQKVGMIDVNVAAGFKWRAALLSSIAKANLCRVVMDDAGDRGKVYVFGKQENVRVVLDMWGWIQEQLERLGFNALRDYMQPPQQGGWAFNPDGTVTQKPWKPKGNEDEKVYLAGFYRGATGRIHERLQAALEHFRSESAQTTALIVVTGTELSTAVHKEFGRLGSWGGQSRAGRDGVAAGRKAGDAVRLTRSTALNGAGGATLRLGGGG